ncbi:23S rRNA (adenine(1618)-N(6))-methyltransferase RlmF [Thalassotalea sp. Y01]|uniref:23S rRNA (adenine(1618)-N(6))-methyltransferase RlmF n=1 Tax=Thalassotalea sp. Y01 TaxID=2729613 RepID=UPI00145E2265|nr:23S rRNA (adenine(1618)-N(6))-methyltransferase RlmF [Thalassotalea sp. Y01]NMP14950.1 23S rRNA (adenine(1618)-N(6))-methyltransferase RlmF [Thalassotalea sp. Y01]
MHPRNKHQGDYNFKQLCVAVPALKAFVVDNKNGKQSIDFSNPKALVCLNKALLTQHYELDYWQLPDGHLCPPIPGRVDYLHYLADLLKSSNNNRIPKRAKDIRLLDIGTGASVVYPLLAHKVYQWQVIASDISQSSLDNAQTIIERNGIQQAIHLRHQSDSKHCFNNIIRSNEFIDITMCNPPFFESIESARAANKRKWQNLNKDVNKIGNQGFNFAGSNDELCCPGGELKFVRRMINESKHFGHQVFWFTSLVANKDNLRALKQALKKANATQVKTVSMQQGQKTSRFIAWSFLSQEQQNDWCDRRFN